MPEKSRVFVVQEMQHDYSSAEQYGELVFLSTREITPTAQGVSPANSAIISGIERKLTDYIPGIDYLLLVGSPVAVAWTVFFALQRVGSGTTHLLLKWDQQARQYARYILDPSKVIEERANGHSV